jgi:DNA-binding NtrC family response regulator
MITVVIAENEEKVREMLSQILGKEGYAAPGGENAIRIVKNKSTGAVSSLEDRVIEFQDELFDKKNAELYKSIVERIERTVIARALERVEGNQLKAARVLGINRNTIRSKIKKLGIDAKKWKTQ